MIFYFYPYILQQIHRFNNFYFILQFIENSKLIYNSEYIDNFYNFSLFGTGWLSLVNNNYETIQAGNNYIRILSDTGIIGLISYLCIFLGLILTFYFTTKRKYYRQTYESNFLPGLVLSLVSILMANFFVEGFYNNNFNYVSMGLIGIFLVFIRRIHLYKKERL